MTNLAAERLDEIVADVARVSGLPASEVFEEVLGVGSFASDRPLRATDVDAVAERIRINKTWFTAEEDAVDAIYQRAKKYGSIPFRWEVFLESLSGPHEAVVHELLSACATWRRIRSDSLDPKLLSEHFEAMVVAMDLLPVLRVLTVITGAASPTLRLADTTVVMADALCQALETLARDLEPGSGRPPYPDARRFDRLAGLDRKVALTDAPRVVGPL